MQHKKGTNPFGIVEAAGSSASQVSPSPARTSAKSAHNSAARSTSANRAGQTVSFAGGVKAGANSLESA